MFMHITCIDLFDHNVGMVRCAKVRFRCLCISLVLNLFDHNVGMVHVPKLDLDVHAYYWY